MSQIHQELDQQLFKESLIGSTSPLPMPQNALSNTSNSNSLYIELQDPHASESKFPGDVKGTNSIEKSKKQTNSNNKARNRFQTYNSLSSDSPNTTRIDSQAKSSLSCAQQLKKSARHVQLLLAKNFAVQRRNTTTVIIQYLSPIFACLMLISQQNVANTLTDYFELDPEIHPSNSLTIPRCISPEFIESANPRDNVLHGNRRGCISVGYHIVGERQAWVDTAMEYVAARNNLNFGTDVRLLSTGDPSTFQNYIRTHMNRTQIGVVFCTTSYPLQLLEGDASNNNNNNNNLINSTNINNNEGFNIRVPCSAKTLSSSPLISMIPPEYIEESPVGISTMVYTILYNSTLNYKVPYLSNLKQDFVKDDLMRALKLSLDNALVEIVAKYSPEEYERVIEDTTQIGGSPNNKLQIDFENARIEADEQDFPLIPSRFALGIDVFSVYGVFYLFVPIMVSFVLQINEILREKEKRLRQGLTTTGLSHFSYIMSWVMFTVITMAVLQAIMVLLGQFFEFDFFLHSPAIVTFSILFTFGCSMQAIGFFITTICSSVKLGYTVAYSFLLFSIVMQIILTTPAFIYYLYLEEQSLFELVFRGILSSYPAFHYSKLFHDVASRTNSHYEVAEGRWIKGPGFQFSDVLASITGKFPMSSLTYTTPSCLESYLYLNISTICFFLLGLYCDHVISSNRGTQESLLYFLKREYWCGPNQKDSLPEKQNSIEITPQSPTSNLHSSVQKQKDLILTNNKNGTPVTGMRVSNLCKTYSRYPFGIKSSCDKKALSNIFFEIEQNELVCLLGHNGAGKSTLIGILTGLIMPSEGTANICGHDIRNGMEEIRSLIGVCPQFDILWDELTAFEHLQMYCRIKQIPEHAIPAEIDRRLSEVLLSDKKHYRVGTFSGGQKRRVSLAIAAIGNPRIIFLDEPTTGMDPKTRSEVWNMIKEMKVHRSVILTTHAMEEADVLSDRIMVVSDGQLKAIGTPLSLKNSHTTTYRLSVILDNQAGMNIEAACTLLRGMLKSTDNVTVDSNSIVFGIAKSSMPELENFFKFIECDDFSTLSNEEVQLRSTIKEWGLSHTTLEEVFMHLSEAKDQFSSPEKSLGKKFTASVQ